MRNLSLVSLVAGLAIAVGGLSAVYGAEPGSGSSGCDALVSCNEVDENGNCIGERQVDVQGAGMCIVASGSNCTACQKENGAVVCPTSGTWYSCKCNAGEVTPYDACITCVKHNNIGQVQSVSCTPWACPPVGAECEELYDGETGDGECLCVAE